MNTLRIEGVTVEKSYAYTFASNSIKDVVLRETSTDGVLLFSPQRATLLTKLHRPLEDPVIEELTYNRAYEYDRYDLVGELNYYNHITEECFQHYTFQRGEKHPFVPIPLTHSTSTFRYVCTDIVEEHSKDHLFFAVDFETWMATSKGEEFYSAATIQIHGKVK
jgi:hypothetical protein